MGAVSFSEHVKIKKTESTKDAFLQAKDNAQFNYGYGGYTGCIAEKNDFIFIANVKSKQNAERIKQALFSLDETNIAIYREEAQAMIYDKWGPAGAIRYPIDEQTDGILFFGFASS